MADEPLTGVVEGPSGPMVLAGKQPGRGEATALSAAGGRGVWPAEGCLLGGTSPDTEPGVRELGVLAGDEA